MEPRYDYVLVGSFGAVWAAQGVREQDKQGRILIVGDEPHPPYDRPPLSKNMIATDDTTPEDAYSKFDDFYPKNEIALHTATRVTRVDPAARSITLENGGTVEYGKLLLATGARPRRLEIPGMDRIGVFVLRHIEDSLAIRTAVQNSRRVVIVGTGYLGMEVGADALARGLDVTFVSLEDHPWSKFASPKLGAFLRSYYESKGAHFVRNDEVVQIEGDGDTGAARTVVTKNGQRIATDLVVVAIGVHLNTELAKEAGLDVDATNGVKVNEFLQTSDPNIWAVGDIAYFKDIALNKEWHAEHHLNAKWQGQTAGRIMAGGQEPYDKIPYFFSDFLDLHMILRGDPQGGKNTLILGDMDSAEFIELYVDDAGRLTTGIAISHEEPKLDPISDTLERLIRAGVNVQGREAEIQAPGFALETLG